MRHFSEATLVAGRAEGVELRFDPHADRAVSARHARFERSRDGWWIEDLDSRNGTWIDGERIRERRRVHPGMRIRFGWEGPEVEVLAGPGADRPERVAVLRTRSRILGVGLVVAVIALGGAVAAVIRSQEAARASWEEERAALVARTDSLIEASRGAVLRLEGEMQGLVDALEDSQTRVQGLQEELARLAEADETDPEELAELRERLQRATAALSRQQLAASLDAPALTARVRPAVAMVYIEFEDGGRSVATGFAVRGDGSIVTNRHVVRGADGTRRPSRIGVQFSGSPQIWPAEVIRVAPDSDLALLRARNLVGGNPVIPGLNARADTLPPGAPVLLLGFPLAAPPTGDGMTPRALSSAGVLGGTGNGRVEIQGWGAEGASGSPVFDATGLLVGVLFGASGEGEDRRLVAVPAASLRTFLNGVGP